MRDMAGGLCLALGLAAVIPAQAATFDTSTTIEGFVPGLTGASTLGLTTGSGSITCPLCDSTVNFITYHNKDNSDWAADVGLSPTFLQGSDPTATWVFLYQIQNTDPQSAAEAQLENFNVTSTFTNGAPVPANLYSSGGFFDATDITPFTVPALDTPNDQTPSQTAAKTAGSGSDNIDPDAVLFSDAAGTNPIASTAVNAGSQPYAGGLFTFDPLIGTNGFSDVLFLTSNDPKAGYVWAETESPGGFGAAGDVPGATRVIPLPASLVFLLSALGGLGYLGRRRCAA